jgi:secreted trypsin-like serine protease
MAQDIPIFDFFLLICWSFSVSFFLDADIAILKSHRSIAFGTYVRPACVWQNDNSVDNVRATIIGWGLNEMETLSSNLKDTDLRIVPQEVCKRDPEFESIVTPRKICAIGYNSIPCKGDSGGGLFIRAKERWYLRGVVSETLTTPGSKIKCGTSKFATYTDVAKFYTWIMKYLQ